MKEEEKEWYQKLWSDFLETPITNDYEYEKEEETIIKFFIWPSKTEVQNILDWFEDKTEGFLPPPKENAEGLTMWSLKREEEEEDCEECGTFPCEYNTCSDCGRDECVCDCEHPHVNEDGYCNDCDSDVRSYCEHNDVDNNGECTLCRLDVREDCEHENLSILTRKCLLCHLYISPLQSTSPSPSPSPAQTEEETNRRRPGDIRCSNCENDTIRCNLCQMSLERLLLQQDEHPQNCPRCNQRTGTTSNPLLATGSEIMCLNCEIAQETLENEEHPDTCECTECEETLRREQRSQGGIN